MPPHHLDGTKLHRLRKAKGDTLKTVSAATGICIQQLCDIEHGRRQMSLHNVSILAHHYNVLIDELLEGNPMRTDTTWFETKITHLERKIDAYKTDARIAELRNLQLQELLVLADALVAASLLGNGTDFARQRNAYLDARKHPA